MNLTLVDKLFTLNKSLKFYVATMYINSTVPPFSAVPHYIYTIAALYINCTVPPCSAVPHYIYSPATHGDAYIPDEPNVLHYNEHSDIEVNFEPFHNNPFGDSFGTNSVFMGKGHQITRCTEPVEVHSNRT